MSSFRAVVFAAIVVLGTVLAVPFAGALALTDAAAVDAQEGGTNGTDGNVTGGNATSGNGTDAPSVGAQMSSFMQTSATNATSEVESGMFEAEYERADNKSTVVEKRADRIERQIEQLRERKQALAEREGELNEVAYTARMSRIVGEIESLERQINGTAAKAEQEDVDVEQFDRMRANVSELRGPKVQAAADAIPGRGPPADRGPGELGPPDDRGGGPPADAEGDSNDRGSAPSGAGASDNASAGDGATAGNDANASNNGGGPPGNDRGPSNDGGPGDGAPGNSDDSGSLASGDSDSGNSGDAPGGSDTDADDDNGEAPESNAGGPSKGGSPNNGGGPGERRPDVTLAR